MRARLLPMPHRTDMFEAWLQEYREREKYEREIIAQTERLKWMAIRNGFLGTGVLFLLGFAMYWIVRLGT